MNYQKTCCFTGHRNICGEHFKQLPELLDTLLDKLVSDGFRHFKTGGAIGFDALCALKCLELKKKYPNLNITLNLCLPCKDQTRTWSEQEKNVYNFILSRADSVTYEEDKYTSDCMYARNRRLVDGSDICVAFLSSEKSGTAYTCNYAATVGVKVINLFERVTAKN